MLTFRSWYRSHRAITAKLHRHCRTRQLRAITAWSLTVRWWCSLTVRWWSSLTVRWWCSLTVRWWCSLTVRWWCSLTARWWCSCGCRQSSPRRRHASRGHRGRRRATPCRRGTRRTASTSWRSASCCCSLYPRKAKWTKMMQDGIKPS